MEEPLMHYVSCGMLVRAGRVFLVHRSPSKARYPNVWDFPGGHLEPGENGRQALVRELREELSVKITPPAGKAILTRQDAEFFQEVWLVEKWDGDIVNAAPDEHDAIGWFSLDEAIYLDLADAEYPALFKQVLV
ncbi:NUDIX domain-containing protein [Arthrobacter sp. N199823]|uniref:NUDIX domain-containing protein n=1 Tax=Arthrobacter sp. N199823 TaxID=2058895 RepID=UPI000CE4E4D8|nr:NUDIX hydrolase [Arthrobacter sp. N199823]